jgi:superfamily II DNA helicase RecQ
MAFPSPTDVPLLSVIRSRTEAVFGCRPCLWQIKVVESILKRDRDVISIAGTGMGKTMTFWIPLLFRPKGSSVIVCSPLNGLGKQNVAALERVGFRAIFIGADTATPENFYVCSVSIL